MKFKKLIQICKKDKIFHLYEHEGVQLLGNGAAAYMLIGHPEYDKDMLFAAADISANEIAFTESVLDFDISDNVEHEELCRPVDMTICFGGKALQPVISDSGISFIDTRLLTPLMDEEYEIYKRDSYFVLKVGLIVKGVVCPYLAQNLVPFLDNLHTIHELVMRETERDLELDSTEDEQLNLYDNETEEQQ